LNRFDPDLMTLLMTAPGHVAGVGGVVVVSTLICASASGLGW
jgi:hypothetical protein